MTTNSEIAKKRPCVEDQECPILKAVAYGTNAASGHNSQPWKIKILSDISLKLFVDPERILPSTDPLGRIMHISQGTFIETLSIGASVLGYTAKVDYFPEGQYPFNEIGTKPVAHIYLNMKQGMKKDPLFDYIYQRSANRKVYEGPLIRDDEIAEIQSFSKSDRVELITINNPDKMKTVFDFLYKAWETELCNYEIYDESRQRMRYSEKERELERDGLSVCAMGEAGLRMQIAEKFLQKGGAKRWHSKAAKSGFLRGQKQKMNSAKALVFLKSKTNNQLDWIITGRILARWELAITKLGLRAHIYSQIMQDYEQMQALQGEFNDLLGVHGEEKVQLAMRIGRAKDSYYTYRRHIKDLLIA